MQRLESLTISQEVMGLVCAKLGQSAFNSMATRRNLTDQDIMELISEQDSGAHIHQKVKTFLFRVTVTLLTQTPQSGLSVQTVLLYLQSTSLQRSQWVMTEAPHINKDSSPLSILMLFFFEIIQLLVEETNRYYHQYLGTLDKEWSPLTDVTVQEMCFFVAIIVQMGHRGAR